MGPGRTTRASSASSTTSPSAPATRPSRARPASMELVLSDEQRILRESAGRMVSGWVARRKAEGPGRAPTPFDRRLWQEIAEAGWLAILVPEGQGGLGLGITDLCLVAELSGRGPFLEPVGAVAVAAGTIAACPDAAGAALVPALVAGERLVVPLLDEDAAVHLAAGQVTVGTGARVRLTGTAAGVPHGSLAAGFLVVVCPEAGSALGYAGRDAAGVRTVESRTVDGAATATVSFADTDARVLAGPHEAADLIARARHQLLLATSAELLGAMEEAHESALDYIRTREQFGRPIGSFQALQHRAVSDAIEVELTRSLLYQVCATVDREDALPGLASAVKAKAAAAALAVTKSAVQMHGAIGYTSELDLGRYMKRVMTLAAQHGNAAWHRRRYAREIGLEEV